MNADLPAVILNELFCFIEVRTLFDLLTTHYDEYLVIEGLDQGGLQFLGILKSSVHLSSIFRTLGNRLGYNQNRRRVPGIHQLPTCAIHFLANEAF